MDNWIGEQMLCSVSQFDKAIVEKYPDVQSSIESASGYLDSIGKECNYLAACELVPWSQYLSNNSKVLDLACGGGWLTAMLSKYKSSIDLLYALDSSSYFLTTLLPQVIRLMGGDDSKIVPTRGLFHPLFFEDNHLDVVVVSSALHHAERLEPVLREIRRVLKPGGHLFVLNETPWSGTRHWISSLAASVRILRDLLMRRYKPISPSISASGYLYDPFLGDRDYPLWYWEKALSETGFDLKLVVNTGFAHNQKW